jgi:hypothetical protein
MHMALPGRRGTYTEPVAASQERVAEPEQTQTGPGRAEEPKRNWAQQARPASNFFKFQGAGDTIEGELKAFFESEYEGKTSVNATLIVDGKETNIRLTTQLERYFEPVKLGSYVKIIYRNRLGKMKNFDFFVLE